MTVSIIAAMSINRVIGRQGKIPWHSPEDLRRFRELTGDQPLIMGRKTFESIGRPLPGRKTIIVTRQADYAAPGCQTASSLTAALRLALPATEVFICGGGDIYRQALAYADRIYLTVIHGSFDGDTTFPEIPEAEFALIASEELANDPAAVFTTYTRISGRRKPATDENG